MSADTPRYLIENHGPDNEALKTAFAGAFQVCAEHGIARITLLVPSKGSFPSTVVGALLGEKVAKALCKGETMTVTANLTMNLESSKTFLPYKSYGMVMGVYLPQSDQNILDSVASAQAIVLLPWTEEEGKAWLSTWNATVLGKSTWSTQRTVLPPAVEQALLSLTRKINLSTGLSHPMDKEAAKQTFRNIKQQGHQVAPEEIRRWALRNNWQPKHAEALSRLAARYLR